MIYLCRHGQTEFNRERRVQGRMESLLTALGRRQAAAMADLLHDVAALEPGASWAIVASPQGRARATAETIGARLGLPVAFDGRLMEIHLGVWEGRLRADIFAEHPHLAHDLSWTLQSPGGETYAEVQARVSAFLKDQGEEAGRRLIVVSHGVAGRILRGAYAGLTPAAALEQDVPQDAVYRLSGGQIDRLDCEPVEEALEDG